MTYRSNRQHCVESYGGPLPATESDWSALSFWPKSRLSQQCAATKLSSVTAIQGEKA